MVSRVQSVRGEIRDIFSTLRPKTFLAPVMLTVLLAPLSYHNFLLFHSLAEAFAIVIGVMMFAITWHTHKFAPNNFLIVLANGFFWLSFLDFLHSVSYKGIDVLPDNNANTPTQFWIATRFLEALLLLAAPYFLNRPVSRKGSFFAFGTIALILCIGIFGRWFPDAYIEGHGLTLFKIALEYVICGILTAAIIHLWSKRRSMDTSMLATLLLAIASTIVSELFFTIYIGVYDLSNVLGHICKIIAFWLFYQATVWDMLTKPYRALAQEVSLRRKVDEALSASELQQKQIIDTLPDLIWLKDVDGKYLACNPMFERLYGATEDQIIGKTDDDFVGPELAAFFRMHDMNAMRAGRPTINEETLTFADTGMQFEAETIKTPLKNENGNIIGVLGIARDISARKKFEKELKLEKTNAEKANRAKSEFLASMSHELRTPLNAILGYAQLLQYLPNEKLTPKQTEYIANIISGGQNLLDLVNDILDLARVESDRLSITLESLHIEDVLAESISYLAISSKERGIEIVDELRNANLPTVKTDRMRCRQIFINLLGNAIKYSNAGGRVWVNAKVLDGAFLRVSVVDEGIGIPSNRQGEIFQMFNRMERDPMKSVKGTGVGLAVSRMLLERLGGRIGFQSEDGAGSTFWFDLPLETNETVMIWTDEYRVGVDPIDKDHQVIFRLMNKIMEPDLPESEVAAVIADVIAYTRHHFRREEAIMSACRYPDLESHRAYHRRLESDIAELEEAYALGHDPEVLDELRLFLRDWWSRHIMVVDKTIAKYAAGKNFEILEVLASD